MSKNSITLVLNGLVTLEDYSKAMAGFTSLIKKLQTEHAKKIDIEWNVEQLESGSAILTTKGYVDSQEDEVFIERIVNDYEFIGEHGERGDFEKIPEYAKKPLQDITSVINGKINSIRFETQDRDFSLATNYKTKVNNIKELNIPLTYYDAIIGKVQNIFQEPTYKFTLYERINHKPVSCYLEPDYEDIMRNSWGKYARVEGLVKVNQIDGLPDTIRQIKNIEVLENENENYSWKKAIGAANGFLGHDAPESIIRQIRDE